MVSVRKKKLPGERLALFGLIAVPVMVLTIVCSPEIRWWVFPGMVLVVISSLVGISFLGATAAGFFHDKLGWETIGTLVGFGSIFLPPVGALCLAKAFLSWGLHL